MRCRSLYKSLTQLCMQRCLGKGDTLLFRQNSGDAARLSDTQLPTMTQRMQTLFIGNMIVTLAEIQPAYCILT